MTGSEASWIEQSARGIISRWDQWEGEAGQIAQQEQCTEAGESHLLTCVVGYLRWMYANHSKNPGNTT